MITRTPRHNPGGPDTRSPIFFHEARCMDHPPAVADGIPLEVNACALGRQFEAAPQQRFSVAKEVTRWVREGSF